VLKGEFMQNRSTWIWAGGKSALSLAPHRLAQADDFFREVGDERLGLGIARAEFTLSGFSHAIGPIGKSAGAKLEVAATATRAAALGIVAQPPKLKPAGIKSKSLIEREVLFIVEIDHRNWRSFPYALLWQSTRRDLHTSPSRGGMEQVNTPRHSACLFLAATRQRPGFAQTPLARKSKGHGAPRGVSMCGSRPLPDVRAPSGAP
jgi:hypothetical protein